MTLYIYIIIWYIYNIIWSLRISWIFPVYDFHGPKRPSSHHPRCAVFGMWALAVFFGQGKSIRTWATSETPIWSPSEVHLKSIWSPSEVHLKSIWKRRSVHQTPSSILESVIFGYFGYKLLTVWICTAACSHHHTPVMRRIWDSRHLWLQCCGRTYKNGWFPSNWCHFQGWNLSTIVKIC